MVSQHAVELLVGREVEDVLVNRLEECPHGAVGVALLGEGRALLGLLLGRLISEPSLQADVGAVGVQL